MDTEQTLRAELGSLRERLEWIEKELDRDKPVPLSDQYWSVEYCERGNRWKIMTGKDSTHIATAYDDATRDIILGIPGLVKACLEAGEFYHQDDITRSLRKMGVEVE